MILAAAWLRPPLSGLRSPLRVVGSVTVKKAWQTAPWGYWNETFTHCSFRHSISKNTKSPIGNRDCDVIVTSLWRHNHENQKSFKLVVLYIFSKVLRLVFTIFGKFHRFWNLGVIWWRHQPLKSQIYPKIGIFRDLNIFCSYFGTDLTNKPHKSIFWWKTTFLSVLGVADDVIAAP